MQEIVLFTGKVAPAILVPADPVVIVWALSILLILEDAVPRYMRFAVCGETVTALTIPLKLLMAIISAPVGKAGAPPVKK